MEVELKKIGSPRLAVCLRQTVRSKKSSATQAQFQFDNPPQVQVRILPPDICNASG